MSWETLYVSWVLFGQVFALLLIAYVLALGAVGHVIDKRREDAIKRKEAGL